MVRVDSAYYVAKVIAAIGRAGARFSVTIPMDPRVKAGIAAIPEDAWTPLPRPKHPLIHRWIEAKRHWIMVSPG